jgi:hypothetical protein
MGTCIWEDRHQEVFMALMFLLEVEVHFNWMWHQPEDWQVHMHAISHMKVYSYFGFESCY